MTDRDQLKAELRNMSYDDLYNFTIKQEIEWFSYGSLSPKQTCQVIRDFNRSLMKVKNPASYQKVGYTGW